MTTHSDLAAKLLRDAATFFRGIGQQNSHLQDEMEDNAQVYDQVADLIESDPTGQIQLED